MTKSKKGYTLTELIVVIAITSILALGIIVGGTRWISWSRFTQQNQIAQMIYGACQNQLTEYSQSGQLESLQEYLSSSTVVDVTKIKDNDGNFYQLENVWPESQNKFNNHLYQTQIIRIVGTPSDYKAYQNGSASLEKTILYDMITAYFYDPSLLLQGAVCVEFTPDEGQVFAVLYSNEHASFSDEMLNNRELSYRKKQHIGYYGVDTLYKSTSKTLKKPSITDVKLNNEESLNLTFRLNKVAVATSELNYEIHIMDKQTERLLLSFVLNPLKNSFNLEPQFVDVYSYSYNNKGQATTKTLKNYPILAYVDEKQVVHVLLDAVDFSANSQRVNDYKSLLTSTDSTRIVKESMSFHRFYINSDNIYCTVRGSGDLYKTTPKKQSNSENPFFASYKEENDVVYYGISNARHLYNIRYVEDPVAVDISEWLHPSTQKYTYQITNDFNWNAIHEKNVCFNCVDSKHEFTPILQLRENHILESVNGIHTISNLNINNEDNRLITEIVTTPITRNDIITTTSKQEAALFINLSGIVQNINFENCHVKGKNNVGLIASTIYNGQINHITIDKNSLVEGLNNVGGVCGLLKNGNISYNKNEATIKVHNNNQEASSLGGIVGFVDTTRTITIEECENYGPFILNDYSKNIGGIAGQVDGNNVMIKNCNSSSHYPVKEVKELMDFLKGENVGGIVGLLQKGSVENCHTNESNNHQPGYVLGKNNVGGIVGTNRNSLLSKNAISNCTNQAHVLGSTYVGGIIGQNGDNYTLNNCINKGFVAGTTSYVGGIAGYNGKNSTMTNCHSELSTSNTHIKELTKLEMNADFVGGIVGYNKGTISSEKISKVTTTLVGNNFLGGIVGFNGTTGMISHYVLNGGFIDGKGNHIGGSIGLNANEHIFEKYVLEANPNLVNGNLNVGGIIGTNIISPSNKVNATFKANNFLGTISGKQNVGGFIGYNQLVSLVGTNDSKDSFILSYVKDYSQNVLSNPNQMIISGNNEASQFGQIKGNLYVGGVIGNNTKETSLVIKDISNKSSIIASECEANSQIKENRNFSYAGGIIGIVQENVILENCKNDDGGMVSTHGTYTGGLAEVNYGQIIHCQANSLGQQDKDYIGGIVGINMEGAVIKDCILKDQTMTGRNVVGGITCENEGTITNPIISNLKIIGNNEIGGIAAYNKGTIEAKKVDIHITSSGEYVGGVVGINDASLNNMTINGTIIAAGQVAGLAGKHQSGTLTSITNNATIICTNGDGAGIIPSSEVMMKDCINNGQITSQKGNGAGITCINDSEMTNCLNTAMISSQNGLCGGIACINNATISHCKVSSPVTLESKVMVGAIASENNGSIFNSLVEDIAISNLEGTKGTLMGGISALNKGTISNSNVQNVNLISNEAESTMGGIAGINENAIIACDVKASLKFNNQNANYYGNMGGIAGINKADIREVMFSGLIQGTSNNPTNAPIYNPNYDYELGDKVIYGYGGIVGINGSDDEICYASISNATLDQIEVEGLGVSNNYSNIGGVAGLNGQGASINEIYFKNTNQIHAISGHVGGVVGYNQGKVSDMDTSNATVRLTLNNDGHIGGIVGYNKRTGIVSHVQTGVNWSILMEKSTQDNGCGGIIGYHQGEYPITNCINYANVTRNQGNSTGGIVGRSEVPTISNIRFVNCENYGTIQALERTGGIVGCVKYNGATFENCTNYGQVNAGNAYAGGILGYVYGSLKTPIYFTNCINHGNITSTSYTAGIVGMFSTSGNDNQAIFNNCVNTGTIVCTTDSSKESGIFNGSNALTGSTVMNCRNYGFGSNGTLKGIGTNHANMVYQDNFNISSTTYPITTKQKINNYYLNTDSIQYLDKPYITQLSLESDKMSFITPSSIAKIISKDINTSNNTYYEWIKGGYVSYTLNLSEPVLFNTLHLYFYRSGTQKRVNDYTIYGLIDHEWKVLKDVYNIDSTNESTIVANDLEAHQFDNIEVSGIKIVLTDFKANGGSYCSLYSINMLDDDGNLVFDNKNYSFGNEMKQNYNISDPMGTKNNYTVNLTQKVALANDQLALPVTYDKATASLMLGSKVLNTNLPLDPTCLLDPNNHSMSQEVYSKDDPYFIMGVVNDSSLVSKPYNLGLSEDFSTITFSYDDDRSRFYEYEMTYYNQNDQEIDTLHGIVFDKVIHYQKQDYINGIEVSHATLKVRAGAYGMEGLIYSSYSDDYQVNAKRTLPTPSIHFQLVLDENQTLQYQCVIDNYEQYEEFCKQENYDMSQLSMVVSNGTTHTFKMTSPYSEPIWPGRNDAGNNMIEAKVIDSSNNYSTSYLYRRESMAFSQDYFINNAIATMRLANADEKANVGFMGNTNSSLLYSYVLQSSKGIVYMRTELVAKDNQLGCDVVLSKSDVRTTDVGQGNRVNQLSGLPNDLLNEDSRYSDIWIRSYPIMMSNNVCYISNDCFETYSYEELKQLYVNKHHFPTNELTDTKLLDENNNLASGYVIYLVGDDKYQVSYNTLLDYNQMTSKTYSSYPTTQMMTNVYYYIYGNISSRVNQPEIYVNKVMKDGLYEDGDINVPIFNIEWDIDQEVGNTYDYVIKAITINDELIVVDQGTTNGMHLISYDLTMYNYKQMTIEITRLGEVDQNNITTTFPSTSTKTIHLKQALPQIMGPSVSLTLDENGIVNKDDLMYDIIWQPIENSELDSYTLTVMSTKELDSQEQLDAYIQAYGHQLTSYEVDGLTITKQLEVTGIKEPQKQVNFDMFEGDYIHVYVKAIAKEDSLMYRDGPDGIAMTLTLPNRLKVPTQQVVFENYKEVFTQEDLENGMALSYKDETIEHEGIYQIAIDIYDEIDGQKLETLVSKDEMSGNLKEASYLARHIDSQYANCYLAIYLRSISESAISSYWTSEASWIQIPKVELKKPELQISTQTLYYDGDGYETKDSLESLPVHQNQFIIDVDSNSNQQIISILKEVNHELAMDTLYIEENDVFYTSTKDKMTSVDQTKVSSLNPQAVYIGSLNSLLEMDMNVDVNILDMMTLHLTSKISKEGHELIFTLPSGIFEVDGTRQVIDTIKQIEVQSLSHKEYFVASKSSIYTKDAIISNPMDIEKPVMKVEMMGEKKMLMFAYETATEMLVKLDGTVLQPTMTRSDSDKRYVCQVDITDYNQIEYLIFQEGRLLTGFIPYNEN